MKYKKFLLIPILIVVYTFVANYVFYEMGIATIIKEYASTGSLVTLSIGETISVKATRGYYFNLIRLPFYSNTIGDWGFKHHFFFYRFIPFLFVMFTVIELLPRRKISWVKYDLKYGE